MADVYPRSSKILSVFCVDDLMLLLMKGASNELTCSYYYVCGAVTGQLASFHQIFLLPIVFAEKF